MAKIIERAAKVEVLLATYNGERYLREQIDSILDQDYPNLRVLAWDDGSTDHTVEILNSYAARYPERLRVCTGGGPTGHPKWNFQRLMKASTAEYLCFSDQDDIWLPQKVSLSVRTMLRLEETRGRTMPLLVFTDLRVVNEQLETLHPSFWKQTELRVTNVHQLSRALGQNVVTGCTAMINRSMSDLAVHMAEETEMHDDWICLLAAALGAAQPIPQCTVLYRQHSNNVIGARQQHKSLKQIKSRIFVGENRRRVRLRRERQAEALLRLHGHLMTRQGRELLEAYLQSGRDESAWRRIATTVRFGFYRSGLLKNITTMMDLFRWKSTDPI